jgi:hypothetical protein
MSSFLPNQFLVVDERDDSESFTALTEEGVFRKTLFDEICPSSSESGAVARREVGLAGRGRLLSVSDGGLEFLDPFVCTELMLSKTRRRNNAFRVAGARDLGEDAGENRPHSGCFEDG